MSQFDSSYGAGRITGAQRIAEIVCERQAAHKQDFLPLHFWRESPWKETYGRVIQTAHALLKIYHAEAVLGMLTKNPKVRSLVPKFVKEKVRDEQNMIDKNLEMAAEAPVIEARDATQAPRPAVKKAGSVRSRLGNL